MSLDKKLSDLPLETTVTGDHELYLTQGGQSKRAKVSGLPITAEAIAAKDAAEAAAAEAEQTASDILSSAGTLKYYGDFATANADLGNISESEFVTVAADENNGGLKALYQKVGGVLTLKNIEDAQDTSALPYLPQDKSQSYWIQKQAVELGLIPQASPSMSCRFAKGEYLLAGKRYDDFTTMGGTFTRSTTATYFGANGKLLTSAIDEPRFEYDPETGEALGLLVEESRENKLLHSNDLSQADWVKNRASVSQDGTKGIIDGQELWKITEDSSNNSHIIRQNFGSFTNGDVLTIQAAFKSGQGGRAARLLLRGGSGASTQDIYLDLETGEPLDSLTQMERYRIRKLPSGVILLDFTLTITDDNQRPEVAVYMTDGIDLVYQGDGASHIYAGFFQLEEGAGPTSYIETGASAVTRAGDVPLIDGQAFADFFNANAGAIVVEYADLDATAGGGDAVLCGVESVGSNGAKFWARLGAQASLPAFAVIDESGNTDEGGNFAPEPVLDRINRYAMGWEGQVYKQAFNGIVDNNASNSDLDRGVLSFLAIGSNSSGNLQPNLHIRSITAYPAEITDDEMVAVTSP